jgi:hypothetical protein
MSSESKAGQHRLFSWWAVCALAAIVAIVAAKSLWAGTSGTDVYRIEEDWQLIVGDPDPGNNGPQVTCTISPADMGTAFCAFDLNYHTQPDYSAGGLQIHTWDPVDPVEYSNSIHNGIMSASGETVTWTQTMTWNNGSLNFRVVNGQSDTWGNFGGNGTSNGHLNLDLPTALSNLNGYSPSVSLDNSGVSFASNQVNSLTLVAVRRFDANGNLIDEITTPQAVHPQQ